MGRRAVALGIAALGLAVGAFSLHVARDEPGYWFAGDSAIAAAAFLAAGWAVIGCGLGSWLRWPPESRFGPLLAAAGFAWFLPEWNNPGIGSSLAFTIGLCLYAACPSIVAHAVLAYPGGRLGSYKARIAVGVAYVGAVLVLGVLPALFFEPQAQGCTQCPNNLLAVSDHTELWADLNRVGLYLGLGWALAIAALAVVKLVRAGVWARPVFAAGAVYLGLVAAWFASSLDRGVLSNETLDRRLWLGQAAALLVLAGAVAWSWVRSRRARSAVAQLVVNHAQSPPPGGLRDVLAASVGDPDLVLSYPITTGRRVDAQGRPVEQDDGREQTSLVRDGQVVAVLTHAPGLLDDEQLVDEVAAAARLALENERLQAEVRARLEELRASRARIVEAGDTERKRLERDLHDGAQQRLVGLSLSLRLARSRLAADGDPATVALLEEADAELRGAIAELRELAHGIFPAVLADEGLAAAIEALAEDGRVPVEVRALPEGRFTSQVETAAYTVVAEAVREATGGVVVEARRSGDTLLVGVEGLDENRLDIVALQDRLGALDGSLAVEQRRDGSITIRAELPCGS